MWKDSSFLTQLLTPDDDHISRNMFWKKFINCLTFNKLKIVACKTVELIDNKYKVRQDATIYSSIIKW
jgi:hypothetical protein